MQTAVIITNNGYFPLNLKYDVILSNFKDIYGNTFENVGSYGFTIECLNSDRKTPINLSKAFKTNIPNLPVSAIDLRIDISAQTKVLCSMRYPYTKKESIHFKLRRSSDGKYIWQQIG